MSYLVPQQPQTFNTTIRKFEPAFMDVDFDISAVATVVTTGPNSFTLKGILRELGNLVGLFWRSKDKWGHPLYSYEQDSDWSNCTWAFDLTYTNCPTIDDAANGGLNRLTMTVTDLSGKPYFVYLQNYMTAGSPSSRSGSFSLPFPNVFAGILADEVIPWDFIDNIFIGFVPPGYTKGAQTPLTPEVEFEANFTNVSVTGTNSTVGYNNVGLPAHDLYIADGYADSYPMTPARVVEQIIKLGYRGQVVLYVGFTQFLSLTWNSGESRFIIDTAKPTLNVPTQQWVTDFCARLAAEGVAVIISVSFELLKEYCPLAWAQYDWKGQQSESGWSPSSTFVSPSSVDGMNYLRDVAVDFVGLSVAAGATTLYQVGEPWWWAGGFRGDGPCFYDTYAQAEYEALPFPLLNITSGFTGGTTMAPNTNFTPGGATTDYFWFRATLDISPTDTGIIFEVGGSTTGIIIYAYNGKLYVQAGNGASFGPAANRFEIEWTITGSGSRLLEVIIDRTLGLILSIDGQFVAYKTGSITGQLAQNNSGRFSGGSGTVAANRGGFTTASAYTGAKVTALVRINNKQWSSPTVPTPLLQTIYDDYSDPDQLAYLLWLEDKLGDRTTWLKDEVKAAYPGTECTVLFYTPTISNPLAPMLTLVNFPQARWSSPEWDFIQVEDYEVIEFGNFDLQRSDLDVPIRDLGYTAADCQYFSGFNLLPATTFIWEKIDKAIWQARVLKGYPEALVWARPQVCRDGWVYNQDDWPTYAANQPLPTYPVFPVLNQLGWSVMRSPVFNTLVSLHASGKEIRSPRAVYPRWEFTLTYEGLKSDGAQSFQALFSFFQSMKGRGNRFAFTDPENNTVTAGFIGTGDGFRTNFTLCRSVGLNYEEPVGFINSLTAVYVNGVLVDPADYQLWYNNGITNNTYPQVLFDTPVADGAVVTADFSYYFLCRFYDDTMTFEEFMKHFHEARSVKFITVKP